MTDATTVTRSIVVDAPVERAFNVFTEDIGSWWPPEHHIIQTMSHMVFEPKVGGHVYDVATDGSECRWSRVLAYEPPSRVVFSWDISTQWQVENDPSKTSEVEVRFVPEGDRRTRVEIEHRHLDRHGEGWEGIAAAVADTGGWELGLTRFAHRMEGAPVGEQG
jgi:uncharacterized protein YndB with AHSA1/START domain